MKGPLSWNTLDDAASWLTEATGLPWTARKVLDAALTTSKNNLSNPGLIYLKAAPPIDTKFAFYRWDAEKGTPSDPLVYQHSMPWQLIPLYRQQILELLACGETLASIARRPEDWDGIKGEYVLVEPREESLRVNLSMVGIGGRDLGSFASNFLAQAGQSSNDDANMQEVLVSAPDGEKIAGLDGMDNKGKQKSKPRVAWRVSLEANIEEIDKKHNGKAGVMDVIRWLKNSKNKQITNDGSADELIWVDDQGTRLTVKKKAVSNATSEARASLKTSHIPA